MENKSWVFLAMCALILSGCGPSFYLRKAERALKKAEQLGAMINTDTVFITKEVIVPEIHLDSIVVVKLGDTIRLEKEKLKIKMVKMPGDTVFVEAECESDTVLIRTPINVYRTIEARGTLRWWHLVIVGLAGVIAGRLLRLFI